MKFRGTLWVAGAGLLFAAIAAAPALLPPETLATERLSLDRSRANLDSADGSGGYRVDLTELEAGDEVTVAFSLTRNGTLSIRESDALRARVAPEPTDGGALALAEAQTGNLTFVAPRDGEYSLAIESPGAEPVRGVVLVTWDPPQEAPPNPIFVGLAKGLLRVTVALALVTAVFEYLRERSRAKARP